MIKNYVIAALAVMLIVFGFGYFASPKAGVYGGVSNFDAITLDSSLIVGGDSTVSGGTVTITTSNSATSTITAGCFQFYATSTATALRFQASTTPGVMVSTYGACPNL